MIQDLAYVPSDMAGFEHAIKYCPECEMPYSYTMGSLEETGGVDENGEMIDGEGGYMVDKTGEGGYMVDKKDMGGQTVYVSAMLQNYIH